MEVRIKIRQRSPLPKPWKWEIYVGKRLVTASNESYTSQHEAPRRREGRARSHSFRMA